MPPSPSVGSLLLFAAASALLLLLLKHWTPRWWRARAVRGSALALVGVGALALVGWAAGVTATSVTLAHGGARAFSGVLVFVVPLLFAVPIAGLVARIPRRSRGAVAGGGGTITRRAVLDVVAAAVPGAALASSGVGLASASAAPALRHVAILAPRLPRGLDGLRVLHLSDLHLGAGANVDDLARAFDRLGAAPDLVVLTGDVADDVRQLRPALALVAQLRPRLGAFASLGNHEYLHGIQRARAAYDASGVELLVDRGVTRELGGARVHVLGVDDPFSRRAEARAFLRGALDRALDGAPSDAFQVLLSHRPRAFDAAASRGVDLTLSGHTHGVQMGLAGRSVFEPAYPEQYLWGVYARGRSRLYTTSGFGHWFPFRLGCPAELALVELRAGPGLTT